MDADTVGSVRIKTENRVRNGSAGLSSSNNYVEASSSTGINDRIRETNMDTKPITSFDCEESPNSPLSQVPSKGVGVGTHSDAEGDLGTSELLEDDSRNVAAEDLVEVVMEEGEPIPNFSKDMPRRRPRMSLRSANGGLNSTRSNNEPLGKRPVGVTKTYRCDLCEFICKKSDHLKSHMRSHTGEKPYACNLCDATFRRRHYLTEHSRVHTGEKPYVCPVCGSSFSQAGNLRVHVKIHTGQKPFACDGCELKFSQRSQLKAHRRTHTGEKPYACNICDARFRHTANLRAHKRTHSEDKPYVCDVCDSKFREAHHLKSHKRTHTGEKPYACDVCEMRYSDPRHLKSHKRHHGD